MKKLILLLSLFAFSAIYSEGFSQDCNTPVQNVIEDFNTLPDPNNLTVLPDCWTALTGGVQMSGSNSLTLALLGSAGMVATPLVENGQGVLTFKARKTSSYVVYLTIGLHSNGTLYEATTYTLSGTQQTYTYDFGTFASNNVPNPYIVFKITSGPNSGVQRLDLDDIDYRSFCQPAANPTALAQDITVKLDATGNVIVNPSLVDNGSTDDCGEFITNFSLDKSLFTCDDLGENPVTLTATDSQGHTATATATITVEPTLGVGFSAVYLDEQGQYSITIETGITSTTTNCEAITYTFDKTDFTCDDLGAVYVNLTATYSGGTATASRLVSVFDQTNPIVITQNIDVVIDESTGLATITPEMIDNGSSDNCGIASMSISKSTFTCSDQGENEVTLTVTDNSGGTLAATAVVNVTSFIPDVAVTTNSTTVCFDGENENSGATISTDGSMEGVKYYLRKNSDNSIIDGPVDGTGNGLSFNTGAVSENTTFHVYAEIPESGTALSLNGSSDHLFLATPGSFDYAIGYTVSFWVKEALGGISNSFNTLFYAGGSNGSSDIEIYQSTATGAITVVHNRGNTGTNGYIITANNLLPNNEYAHLAVSFDGTTIRIMVNGEEKYANSIVAPLKSSGSELAFGYLKNTSFPGYQSFDGLLDDIRIYDVARPAVEILSDFNRCISGTEDDLILYFDMEAASGTVVTDLVGNTPAQLTGGGSWVEEAAISCAYNCSRLMSQTITIGDDVAPTVVTKNVTLDYTGAALEITAADIDNGSSDNCTATESLIYTLTQSTFDCDDEGEQTIMLSVTDDAGNTTSAEATVTVHLSVDDVTITPSTTSLCPSSVENVIVSLSNSFEGLNYSLRNSSDNSVVVGPMAGTGGPLEFDAGSLTESTTFNVFYANEVATKYALDFDGQNDYLNAGTGTRGITTEVTVGAWVRTFYNGNIKYIVTRYDGLKGYLLMINSAGKAIFDGRDGSGLYRTSGQSITSVVDNEWHYIVGTASTTTGEWKIYVDGVLESSSLNNQGGTSLSPVSETLLIGAYYTTYTQGSIDEVAIWDAVLDEETILGNSDKCVGVSPDNTVAYFDFDEGSGTIVSDQSSLAINATLVNMIEADWITDTRNATCGLCERQLSSEVTITVGDDIAPIILTRDITIVLDENDNATITPADIDNGSSDNCTEASSLAFSLDVTTFGINELGENTVTLTVADANGNSATGTSTVTVSDKVLQSVTFTGVSDKIFGGADFSISATVDSGLPVAFMVINGGLTITESAIGTSGGGSATFTITGGGPVSIAASNDGDATYAPLQETITFNIAKADQTLTVESVPDKAQTSAPFVINATVNTGLELSHAVSGPATISGSTVTLDGTLGTVTVTVSQQGTDNYNAVSESISFEVTEKADQTITFTGLNGLTYGDADQTLSATASSGLAVTYTLISGPASITGNVMSITGAGDVTIEASQAGDDDFLSVSQEVTFSVNPAALTATADNQSIIYGAGIPQLTISYSGFVNGEDASVLTADPVASTVADGDSNAGTYSIDLSTGTAANYTITTVPGTLTINPATATVTIADLEHVVDGTSKVPVITTDPAGLSFTVTYDDEPDAPSAIGNYLVEVTIDEINYVGNATATLVISNILGIESSVIRISPNPVTNTFEAVTDEALDIEVFDLFGQLLLRSLSNQVTDVSHLPNGTYLVKILSHKKNERSVYRLIKK